MGRDEEIEGDVSDKVYHLLRLFGKKMDISGRSDVWDELFVSPETKPAIVNAFGECMQQVGLKFLSYYGKEK